MRTETHKLVRPQHAGSLHTSLCPEEGTGRTTKWEAARPDDLCRREPGCSRGGRLAGWGLELGPGPLHSPWSQGSLSLPAQGLVTSPRGEPSAPRQQASALGTPDIPVQGSSMVLGPRIPTCCPWMQVPWAHRLSTPQPLHPLPKPPLALPRSHSPHGPPHTQEPILQAQRPPPPGAGRPCLSITVRASGTPRAHVALIREHGPWASFLGIPKF